MKNDITRKPEQSTFEKPESTDKSRDLHVKKENNNNSGRVRDSENICVNKAHQSQRTCRGEHLGMADTCSKGLQGRLSRRKNKEREDINRQPGCDSTDSRVGDSECDGQSANSVGRSPDQSKTESRVLEPERSSTGISGMADSVNDRHRGSERAVNEETNRAEISDRTEITESGEFSGTSGYVHEREEPIEWLYCRDEKYRPIKSFSFEMVNGTSGGMGYCGNTISQVDAEREGEVNVTEDKTNACYPLQSLPNKPRQEENNPGWITSGAIKPLVTKDANTGDSVITPNDSAEARVQRLKGYGNAIVAPVAEEFIKAFMEATSQ